MDDFEFTPHSDAPNHQLVTESISSYTLQAIAGLIIKLGKLAETELLDDDAVQGTGSYLRDLGKEFGGQVLSQCHHVGAVDLDVPISFTVPVEYVSDICKILTNGLRMGKVSPEMHDAWTPFALEAIEHIPGGNAKLRKALFRRDNPEHPGFRADLN
jgi:hypothetical protein